VNVFRSELAERFETELFAKSISIPGYFKLNR